MTSWVGAGLLRAKAASSIAALAVLSWIAAPAVVAQQVPESLYGELHWRMVGPFRGGRTRAVAGVPSQPNVFYVAQVNGGVWKTDNSGRTWTPIFDGQPTQSVGAIAVAPSDPNIVYVASGEGLQRPDLSIGDGIYKSTDAGTTWVHLGLRDGQQIPQLVVDPRDPNRLFAAVLGHPYGPNAERGIFRSTDGGATWQKVLFKDENTGGADVEFDPSNPEVVYASLWAAREGPWEDDNSYTGSTSGLFKSTDGGSIWTQLSSGLPEKIGQITVAIAPSNPGRIYAAVAAASEVGIYRSEDAGATWTRATTDRRPTVRIGGGDLPVLRVDPKNPDVVYVASIVTWKSTDAGRTWTGIRGAPGGDDYQNIWINPADPEIILLASDQGAIITVDGGKEWSSWYNQPTAQLYHAIADNSFPYRLCAGQQESGSVCISSRGNDGQVTLREWHPVGIIEYGYAAPDPLDPDIVYGAGRNQVSRYDWRTGQTQDASPIPSRDPLYRTDRTEPILFSPVDPHVLFFAANFVFKTIDGGRHWLKISPDLTRARPGIPASLGAMAKNDPNAEHVRGAVYSLGPSFRDVNTLWAGTDDGLIWVTRDGGKNWKDVTPTGLIPWSKVTQLVASHFDDETAYASVSRFRIDDLHPYLYRTRDGGKTWTLIVNGLPENAPVDSVREDPVRKGLLFAGTENAVWVSFDDGEHWQSLQLNLPHTAMRDLWIKDDDLIVATHGRGFWILDDIEPLREASSEIAEAGAHLFRPATAWRVRWNTNTDTPLPPDEPAAPNPPDGAAIDYYLKAAPSGPVTINILDAGGQVVRKYSSADAPEFTEAELEKTLTIPTYWVRWPQRVSIAPGMHRLIWDLHGTAPESLSHEYPIAAVPHDTPREPRGPLALPGTYTVKLSIDGASYSQTFEVKMDPRVPATAADLEAMAGLEQKLADAMDRSFDALQAVRKFREGLKQKLAGAAGSEKEKLAELDKQAAALVGSVRRVLFGESEAGGDSFARLNSELAGLYIAVGSADAAPTAAQSDGAAQLFKLLDELLARWAQLKPSN